MFTPRPIFHHAKIDSRLRRQKIADRGVQGTSVVEQEGL